MLIKILFTLAVILVVILIFRNRRDTKIPHPARNTPAQTPDQDSAGLLSTRAVAYLILAVLVAISVSVFVINYQSDNQIITIRVIAEDGMNTVYQAKQKSIKGRHFITLDGKQVVLGDGDRIEIDHVEGKP